MTFGYLINRSLLTGPQRNFVFLRLDSNLQSKNDVSQTHFKLEKYGIFMKKRNLLPSNRHESGYLKSDNRNN